MSVSSRITPAYAGTTFWSETHHSSCWDHPRLRGNYKDTISNAISGAGSPPLTRELHALEKEQRKALGITPAYAGTTFTSLRKANTVRDHPRLRGNYSNTLLLLFLYQGSPPLTRELPIGTVAIGTVARITPAYAGTTVHSLWDMLQMKDHPRLRGNYVLRTLSSKRYLGSPPLTRELRIPNTILLF